MEFHADKAFFKSDTIDPFTQLPIYVFDSSFLPNFTHTHFDKRTIDTLLVKAFKRIIRRIPQEEYALVCFTSGFRNFNNTNNTWVTALKCFQLLPDDLKVNMHKAYMVHESWLVRSFSSIVSNVVQMKLFKNSIPASSSSPPDQRLVYCKDLTTLSKFVDITKLRIGLEVYLYDLQFAEKLIIPYTVKPKSNDYQDYLDLIKERATSRLLVEGPKNELVFTKPGNPKKLGVLMDAIERGNYLDMSQWDIYVMGSLHLHTLRNLDEPLVPIDLIELPISDDLDYTTRMFQKIINHHYGYDEMSKLFEILLNMIEHSSVTRHTSKSISKAITPALCQEKVSIKTNNILLIGQRYIKNLLEHWDDVVKGASIEYIPQRSATPQRTTLTRQRPTPPQPRKVAFTSSSMPSSFGESSGSSTGNKSTLKKRVQIKPPKTSEHGTDITDMEMEMPPPMPHRPTVRNASTSSFLSVGSLSSSESTDSLLNALNDDNGKSKPVEILKSSGSTDSLIDDLGDEPEIKPEEVVKDIDDAQVLADVTAALNKLPKNATKKKRNSVLLKFAEGYSSMEGQKKVNKLAKLYEERLMGIKILNQMEK